MELSELEREILKIIKGKNEAFGEECEVAATQAIPPDHGERICEGLAAKGYLEAIGDRKKYRLSKEGEKVLKG